MRLIDADKLKREDLCDLCGSADCSNCFMDEDFQKWIDSQPTVNMNEIKSDIGASA